MVSLHTSLPVAPATLAAVFNSSSPSSEDAVTGAAEALDERYGRTRQRGIDRRLAWTLGGLAVLAGLAVLIFGGWQRSSTVESRILHYRVMDARAVTVDFEVTAEPDAPVACALEALSPSFATVGWKIVELPQDQQRTRRFSETLLTTHGATTGTIRSCWVVEHGA